MSQSRVGSLAEAGLNIAIGFGINFAAQMLIFPRFGFHVTPGQSIQIGIWFTAISLVRSYILRRWFNGLRIFTTKT